MHAATLASFVILTAIAVPAQDGTKQDNAPSAQVYEVVVRKKPSIDGIDIYNEDGLEIKIAARLPGASILALDEGATQITKFVDDTGKDLLAGTKQTFQGLSLAHGTKKGTDTASLALRTTTLPAAKAGRITVEAQAVFISSSGEGQATQEIALKKGTKITAGPVPMTIGAAKKPDFGSAAIVVEFQSKQALDAIKKIEFLGADGKPLETSDMGSGSMTFGKNTTYSKSIGLDKKLAKAKIRITFYKNLTKVALPLKLDIGLGL